MDSLRFASEPARRAEVESGPLQGSGGTLRFRVIPSLPADAVRRGTIAGPLTWMIDNDHRQTIAHRLMPSAHRPDVHEVGLGCVRDQCARRLFIVK